MVLSLHLFPDTSAGGCYRKPCALTSLASAEMSGAHLDTPTIADVSCSPLPGRHERGWGEGLFPSNCRALLKSPLLDPTSPSCGEGIDRGLVVVLDAPRRRQQVWRQV